jgi:arginyl-tRNA synthetase
MKFKISNTIFNAHPDLLEAVVVLRNINNLKNGSEILKLLRNEEKNKRKEFEGKTLSEHPKIKPWREAFRNFGSKPNKYSSSVEALLKRVISGNDLPDISPLVNLYNYFSIKHILPFGGEDFAGVYGDMELKYSNGNEAFTPILSDKQENPDRGEVAWIDDYGITCRKWNWRQCDRTKITENTKEGYFIIDALPPITKEEVKKAAEEFIVLAKQYLNAEGEIFWMEKNNTVVKIDIKTKQLSAISHQPSAIKPPSSKSIKKKQPERKKRLFDEYADTYSIKYQLREVFYKAIRKAGYRQDITKEEIKIEHPQDEDFGDFSTNVSMILAKKTGGDVKGITDRILKEVNLILSQTKYQDLILGRGYLNGFINLDLHDIKLLEAIRKILTQKEDFGRNNVFGSGQKWDVEHTSPNPNKTMHLGHLRNNITGMSLANIWEALGVKVIRDCIDNDRGIAIARLMWGYLKFARKDKKENTDLDYWYTHQDEWLTPKETNVRSDKFVDQLYIKASEDFKNNEETTKRVKQMVIDWEHEDKKTWSLWERVLKYSHEGQAQTLERLGSRWDHVWHEHEIYKLGKELVEKGLKKGVFKKSQGAIITDLKEYGIPDTVVIKSDGTSLYITQDLALAKLKKETFEPDKIIYVVGLDQSLALKQVFAVIDQLGIVPFEDFLHIAYGYMSIKGKGKMSSREGTVVYIDDIIDEARQQVYEHLKESKFSEEEKERIAETVAVGAIKYSILKVGRMTNTAFDFKESLSFEGDSGPYLQYTYARARSILRETHSFDSDNLKKLGNDEEIALLRSIYKLPEVVFEAGNNLSPNLICSYLFDLAQKFNFFYKKHKVLKAETDELRNARLALTAATAQVIKNGLYLLGIEVLEKM